MSKFSTVWKSFRVLYSLPPEKVQAFVESYDIYKYDWKNEEEIKQKMGEAYYSEIKNKLIDWYCVINHLCSLGEVEKMYIPPAMDLNLGIIENQNLFEEKLAKDLSLGDGKRALDIGCGRGRVAMHIAKEFGCTVYGINIDPDQIQNATMYSALHGLSHKFHSQMWDLNDLPLPFTNGFFDAIYHVQVFSLCKDLSLMCQELFRLLKPGGKFGCLDWILLPDYDPNNQKHRQLMNEVKPLVGAIGSPRETDYIRALQDAGFKVIVSKNLSIDGLQAPLIEKADVHFNKVSKTIKHLTKCKMLPSHFKVLLDRLTQGGKAFVEADRLRLVTTSYYIVAEKPS